VSVCVSECERGGGVGGERGGRGGEGERERGETVREGVLVHSHPVFGSDFEPTYRANNEERCSLTDFALDEC
jgi:hypothetical protein